MFFIGGISSGRKDIPFTKTVICEQCGSYGRYQVFMTFMYFSFFFIPLFKWNRKYYVQMSCCSTIYQLDSEVGKKLAAGEAVDISSSDLTLIQSGRRQTGSWSEKKTCNSCGYETTEDFEYCPKCGKHF